jgi:hypothetical protein
MTLPQFENHQTNEFLLMLSNLHILNRLNVGGISVELIERYLRSTLQKWAYKFDCVARTPLFVERARRIAGRFCTPSGILIRQRCTKKGLTLCES